MKVMSVKQTIFRCVPIVSYILDEVGEAICELRPGSTYGHCIGIGVNQALWPLDLNIVTGVQDPEQLSFVQSGVPKPNWGFRVIVYPNHSQGERSAILQCFRRNSDRDLLTTTVSMGASYLDTLSLEVKLL
jgi:hypothetical protein